MKALALAFVLILSGCSTTQHLTTKTVPVGVPLLYSPAPAKIDRPELPHLTMTPEQLSSDGEVVKHYAASLQALLGYSEQLEKQLSLYQDIHDAYAEQRAKLIKQWKEKTGEDIVIENPPEPTPSTHPSP